MLAGRGKRGHIRLTLGAPALLLMLLLAGLGWGANICFPDALPSLLRLSVEDQPNTQATLNAYLYALDSSSGQRQAVPISGGLLLVSWGDYPAHACRMVTGGDGKVNATFSNKGSDYPGGGESRTYTVTFCPFTAYNDDVSKPNSVWMANCARFKDSGTGKAITRLNYETVSVCTGAPDNQVDEKQDDRRDPPIRDLGDDWQPSTSFLTLRNNSPSAASAAFCWGLAAVFGLLFSAMFITGRNPLSFLDWGATRSVRVNRAAGFYIPMSKNVSIAPASIAMGVMSAVNTVSELTKSNVSVSQGDVTQAAEELKVIKEADKGIQNDPKADSTMKDKSTARVTEASKKLEAAQDKLGAAQNLTKARESGDKSRIAAAERKYEAMTGTFNQISKTTSWSRFDMRMQIASKKDPLSDWLKGKISEGINIINPLKNEDGTTKTVFGSSLLGNVTSALTEGMVKTVALAIPGMAMGRGKFGMKRVTAALEYSGRRQARAIVKEGLMEAVRWGANMVAPLLVHGVPLSRSQAEKNLNDSKKNLENAEDELGVARREFEEAKSALYPSDLDVLRKHGGVVPQRPSDKPAEYQRLIDKYSEHAASAEIRFNLAQEAYQIASADFTPYATASSSLGGLATGLMNPLFELMADKWFGSDQPPRLQAMSGAGALLGLTVSEYLTNPMKYAQGFNPQALQRQINERMALLLK